MAGTREGRVKLALAAMIGFALGLLFSWLSLASALAAGTVRRAAAVTLLIFILAWLVRALILIPGTLAMAFALAFNEADLWSTRVIEQHRRRRKQRIDIPELWT